MTIFIKRLSSSLTFLSSRRFDESLLSQGLRKMFEEPDPVDLPITDTRDRSSKLLTGLNPGYLNTELSYALIQEVGIDQARPHCVNRKEDLEQVCQSLSFPLAMKADGLLHKSDQKGVILHIQSLEEMTTAFDHLTSLEGCTGVLIQAMVEGLEVYMGAKRVQGFPPLVFCGFGGIYLEIVEDLAQGFAPLTRDQAHALLRQLKMFKVLKGARGQQGVDLEKLAAAMVSLSELMHYNPEIVELDINPLKVTENYARAVDVRIKIG